MRNFESEVLGISFTHPIHWHEVDLSSIPELQGQFPPGEVPPIVIFTTSDGVELQMKVDLFPSEELPPEVKRTIEESQATDIQIANNTVEGKCLSIPGQNGEIVLFAKGRRFYTFGYQNAQGRFKKDLAQVLDSIKFIPLGLFRQPVTSILCKQYTSTDGNFGFKIDFPEDWTIERPESDGGCKKIVFNYVRDSFDENFSLRFSIKQLSLPLSVTTTEYCTLLQNHIFRSGTKYSESNISSAKPTKKFIVEKPNGAKVFT